MRIALVHSYYRSDIPSGENIVVDAQRQLLAESGHDVVVVSRSSDKLAASGAGAKIRAGLSVATGTGHSPIATLQEFAPDVVHVHNLFPNWGTHWLAAWQGPVVATLHNFRSACARGTFYRDGHLCFDCLDHSSVAAVAHACYRESRVASVPLAIATRGGAGADRVVQRADSIIVLSERARAMHVLAGVPAEKIALIPNFTRRPAPAPRSPSRHPKARWVYLGRLSEEKGVLEMVAHWPDGIALDVYGEGPLRVELEGLRHPDVAFHGAVSPSEVPAVLARAAGIVFPSRAPEGAVPLSYVEGLAAGLPVLCWAGNGAADDVDAARNGLVIGSWDQASAAIAKLEGDRDGFSLRSRTRFDEKYSPESWMAATIELYNSVMKSGRA